MYTVIIESIRVSDNEPQVQVYIWLGLDNLSPTELSMFQRENTRLRLLKFLRLGSARQSYTVLYVAATSSTW